jgi:hypothetical protein
LATALEDWLAQPDKSKQDIKNSCLKRIETLCMSVAFKSLNNLPSKSKRLNI